METIKLVLRFASFWMVLAWALSLVCTVIDVVHLDIRFITFHTLSLLGWTFAIRDNVKVKAMQYVASGIEEHLAYCERRQRELDQQTSK